MLVLFAYGILLCSSIFLTGNNLDSECERTSASAVDDVADPRVVDALHVELVTRPVAAHDQMIGVQSSSPTVNDSHLIRTADRCTVTVPLRVTSLSPYFTCYSGRL